MTCRQCKRLASESCCYVEGCAEREPMSPFEAFVEVLIGCAVVLALLYVLASVQLSARIAGAREAFEAVAAAPKFQPPERKCWMNWVADPNKKPL